MHKMCESEWLTDGHGIRLFYNARDHLGMTFSDVLFRQLIKDGIKLPGTCLWCWEYKDGIVAIETKPDWFEPLYCIKCLKGTFRK